MWITSDDEIARTALQPEEPEGAEAVEEVMTIGCRRDRDRGRALHYDVVSVTSTSQAGGVDPGAAHRAGLATGADP